MSSDGGSFIYSIPLRFAQINGGRSRPRQEGESAEVESRKRELNIPQIFYLDFFPLFCEEKLQKSPLNVVCESFCTFDKTEILGSASERRQPRRLIHSIRNFLLALKLSAFTDFRLSSADAVMPPKGGSFIYSIALRFAQINGGRSRPRQEGESAEVEGRKRV